LTVAFFIKTTKTVYHLKSNEVTVVSINPADELVISPIFVDNNNNNCDNANDLIIYSYSHSLIGFTLQKNVK